MVPSNFLVSPSSRAGMSSSLSSTMIPSNFISAVFKYVIVKIVKSFDNSIIKFLLIHESESHEKKLLKI